MLISQSLIKEFGAYVQDKTCGLQIKAKYLDGVDFPSSDAQRLGLWFEYQCTGALPRNGQVPEPDKTAKGELTASYKRMQDRVELYKSMMAANGFKLIKAAVKIEAKGLVGTIDLLAEKDGRLCIIDIKTSGLLNDKWNDMGWSLDGIEHKTFHSTQVRQYQILLIEDKQLDYVPDFYFFLFSNTNEDARIYKATVEFDSYNQHLEKAFWIKDKVEQEGYLQAKPEYMRCLSCPLKNTCKEAITVPEVTEVIFSA